MIREATPADAAAIAAIYAPLVTDTIISFEEERSRPRWRSGSREPRVARRREDGEVVGYAYAARFHPRAAYRWSAEASIYLAPEARGRGIGSGWSPSCSSG